MHLFEVIHKRHPDDVVVIVYFIDAAAIDDVIATIHYEQILCVDTVFLLGCLNIFLFS